MSDPTLSDPTFLELAKWAFYIIGGGGLGTITHVLVKRKMNGGGSPHPSRRNEDLLLGQFLKNQEDTTKSFVQFISILHDNGKKIENGFLGQNDMFKKALDRFIEASRCNYKDKPKHGRED